MWLLQAGTLIAIVLALSALLNVAVFAQNNLQNLAQNPLQNQWQNPPQNRSDLPATPALPAPQAPSQDITQLKLGRAAFEQRDYPHALEAFYRFRQQRPNNLAVHFWLGTTLQALGRDIEAEKEYEECLNLAASIGLDSSEMRTNLANNLIHQGYIKEPLFDYRRSILINPRSPESHLGLAKCLIEQGNFDEALVSLGNYQKAGGQDISAILLHGLALAGKDQYGPARQDLNTFLNAAQNGGYNQAPDQNLSSYREKYVTTSGVNQGAIDLARRMLDEMQQRN